MIVSRLQDAAALAAVTAFVWVVCHGAQLADLFFTVRT